MGILIGYIVCWVVAFMAGIIAAKTGRKKPVGTLRIDNSEPDESPLLFLELSTDPRHLLKEKQVVLDVNTKSYLSQD